MNYLKLATTAFALTLIASSSKGAFHAMQIEEIIGGVDGNTNAQAIQLRLRAPGHNQVQFSRIQAWDAAGANPVLLIDMGSPVTNGNGGDNILIASSSFNTIMASVYGAGYASNFTLTNLIPASYLTGGKVTFEDDGGLVYWSLAFGAYTGSNSGDTFNDGDGNFGAPAGALPINSRQGIRFQNTFGAASTTNLNDYTLSANPATVRNNQGNSFVVAPEPGSVALLAVGVLAGLAIARRRQS